MLKTVSSSVNVNFVSSVTGTAPIVSSGGLNPAISITQASASTNGYLSSTDWNTFNNKGSGTVTSVTGTAPVVSSGGTTPAISMAAATTSVNGYLTSTDWTTFNNKQAALVSGTNLKTVNGTTLLGSGDLGTITYAYGGTGQTTVTTGDLLYGSATNTWSKLGIGSTGQVLRVVSGAPAWGADYVGTVTSVAASVPSFLSITGSPITTSGTLAIGLSGTALPTTSGGTGLTSFTANGVVYASSSSVLATGSGFVFDGTNVGIGTSSPTALRTKNLEVSSSGTNDSAAVIVNKRGSGISTLRLATVGGASGFDINFNFPATGDLGFYDLAAGANRMTLASTGIVTMSAYGAGTATFSAAGVISSVSDETWKIKDGAPVNPDAMIKKLQPGYWYYNEEKREIFGKDRQLGFYAQNVNAAIGPEAAPEPEEGKPWGYYDRSVLAVVVMSLQKALDTIESLTTRLTALEQK